MEKSKKPLRLLLPVSLMLMSLLFILILYVKNNAELRLPSVQWALQRTIQYNENLLGQSVCTLQYLTRYAEHFGKYPTMPFNQIGLATSTAPVGNYSCWFPDQYVRQNVTSCEMKKNVSKIVILGDSNGIRYWNALIGLLRIDGWNCTTVKEEQPTEPGIPDPTYFVRKPTIPLEDIRFRTRDCHGCISTLGQCSLGEKQLEIEYLALEFMLDSEVTTMRKISSKCAGLIYCPHADTYQEFIFREYLADRYPDVLLFFTSIHDIIRHTLKHIKLSANFFFNLVESYMPPDSYVIIMDGMKRDSTDSRRYENKWTANEMQVLHNNIVYETVYSRLINPQLHWYAFPTLFDNSTTTNHMYADYVHRTPAWYTSVTGYLLQLLCIL